ncbi:MAG: AAA family ATPase [Desulfobaccales bacterium]
MILKLPRKYRFVNPGDEDFGEDPFYVEAGDRAGNEGLSAKEPEISQGYTLQEALLGPKPLVMTFGEFKELDLPKREFLLNGDFPLETASITLISSDPGIGKTMLALEIAKMVATGDYGLGGTCNAPEALKVLYADGELAFPELKDRAEIFSLAGITYLTLLSKLYLELKDTQPSLELAEKGVRDILTKYIFKSNFKLVIIDNIYSLFQIDLNSANEWAPINQWLLKLRSHGVATILIHHTGKGGEQLGSASKLFNINTALVLNKAKPADGDEKCCCFSIKVKKQRGQGLNLEGKKFIFRNRSWTVEGQSKVEKKMSTKVTILKGLAEGKTQEAIAKEVGKSQVWISKLKKELITEGLLTAEGKITEQGQQLLDESEGGI